MTLMCALPTENGFMCNATKRLGKHRGFRLGSTAIALFSTENSPEQNISYNSLKKGWTVSKSDNSNRIIIGLFTLPNYSQSLN